MPNAKPANKNNTPGNARAKPRNNRQRSNRKGGSKSAASQNSRNNNSSKRTPDTIISTLTKSMKEVSLNNSMATHPYSQARLRCCLPRTIPIIPDGSSSRAIRVCLYAVDRISFAGAGAKSCLLGFWPVVPTPGVILSNFSSVLLNGSGNGVPNSNNTNALGFGISNQFATLAKAYSRPGSSSNAFDIYNAANCRIISQTHDITYTGPVNTCSGLIRSWESETNIYPLGAVTAYSSTATAPITGTSVQSLAATGNWAAWAPVGTEILGVEYSNSAQPPPSAVSVRPEQGMTLRLGHKTGKYSTLTCRNTPPAVVAISGGVTSTTGPNMSHFYVETGTDIAVSPAPNVLAYDNDWTSHSLLIENVNSDASFAIQSCVCVEFSPVASSPFYPLANRENALNTKVMEYVEAKIRSEGPAIPHVK